MSCSAFACLQKIKGRIKSVGRKRKFIHGDKQLSRDLMLMLSGLQWLIRLSCAFVMTKCLL